MGKFPSLCNLVKEPLGESTLGLELNACPRELFHGKACLKMHGRCTGEFL